MAAGFAAILVLRRVISDGVTVFCWLTPSKPVRNAATRSLRGKLDGAMFAIGVVGFRMSLTALLNSTSSSAGNVGLVTYFANWPSSFGSLALKRSLSGRPITSSLTSGADRRETCVNAPPLTSGFANVALGLRMRAWRRLADVQPPITPLPLPVRQAAGSSSASVVMLASEMMSLALLCLMPMPPGSPPWSGGTSASTGTKFTRSNTLPRLTTKLSSRCPTNTRPLLPQPGTEISWMKLFAYCS